MSRSYAQSPTLTYISPYSSPFSSLSTQAGGHGERLCRLRTRLQLGATATGQRAASVDIPQLCTLLLRDRTTGFGHRAVQSLHEPRPRSAAAHRSKSTTAPARPVAARCVLVGLVSTQSKQEKKEGKEEKENESKIRNPELTTAKT